MSDELRGYRRVLDRAERKVAWTFDIGLRGFIISVLVVVAILLLFTPHSQGTTGFDVLFWSDSAVRAGLSLPSVVFVWGTVVVAVVSVAALSTQRWVLAMIAEWSGMITMVFGVFSLWTRQSRPPVEAGGGPPGVGLILGELVIVVIILLWASVVWIRTPELEALERQAREEGTTQSWQAGISARERRRAAADLDRATESPRERKRRELREHERPGRNQGQGPAAGSGRA